MIGCVFGWDRIGSDRIGIVCTDAVTTAYLQGLHFGRGEHERDREREREPQPEPEREREPLFLE